MSMQLNGLNFQIWKPLNYLQTKKRALFAQIYTTKAKATRQLIVATIRSTLLSIKKGPLQTGTREEAQHELRHYVSALGILIGK